MFFIDRVFFSIVKNIALLSYTYSKPPFIALDYNRNNVTLECPLVPIVHPAI